MTETDTILVCSLDESTGKTAIAIALGRRSIERGESAGYMKPKGTRLQSVVGKTLDEDPKLARALMDVDADMALLEPIVYSPTFVEGAIAGTVDVDELHDTVRESFETLAADHDRMIVEGGGRIDLGGAIELSDVDLASLLDARVVLVAGYEDVYDVDSVLAAADRFGDRFAGVCFNAVRSTDASTLETDGISFLESRGVPVLGVVPRDERLAGVTVDELASEIGGELLVESGTDRTVERFSVGAMGADSALRHFRRYTNTAVVTGGDRSEIQTAALEAPGITCLILTGGHRTSGAVLGKAADESVPIVSVRTDTLTAVERAEAVVRSGRSRDEETIERMESLLADFVDVDRMFER
ncbi:phosphotransacetylase family protein [Halovivax gelatinilyticus]|uniref:phosphotransacetylase family protein n=1 Tax=Halovivax gelatinilyticus TaxID=2961597 RepID=UPI0020CA8111|nr:phosphotransacetylase family protein [Halovivax gelatinilyticus]